MHWPRSASPCRASAHRPWPRQRGRTDARRDLRYRFSIPVDRSLDFRSGTPHRGTAGIPLALKEITMTTMRVALAAAVTAASLSGCYVVPVAPDGMPVGAVMVPGAYPAAPTPYVAPVPAMLNARLYP